MEELAQSWLTPFVLALTLLILCKGAYYIFGLTAGRHPLSAGAVLWLVTGDFNLLLVALFFELFWLDLFYVGTFVPPDGLFAYLVFTPSMLALGLESSEEICLPLLMALPFAALAAKTESRLRLDQNRSYTSLNRVIEERGDIVAATRSVMRRGMARLVMLCIMFYAFSAMLLFGVLAMWTWKLGAIYRVEWASWGFLLCLASLGGLLALRITWAKVCFIACVLTLGGIFII